MHAVKAEEMQPSTSQQNICSIQSLVSAINISDIDYNDQYNDKQAYSQFNVPENESCLFWAVTLAYLISAAKDGYVSFPLRYMNLFGSDENVVTKMDSVKTAIQNHNPFSWSVPPDDYFEKLVKITFRNRVVDFMEANLDRFEHFPQAVDEVYRLGMRDTDTWGGDPEIQAISLMLNCRILVDGQIFPLNSQDEENEPERKTVKLFHVNRSDTTTQRKNYYNYGLERIIHVYFHRMMIDYIYKLIDLSNNLCNISDKSTTELELSADLSFFKFIDTKVMCRINNKVKLEELCVQKLANILQKYQLEYEQENLSINDSIRLMCCLLENPEHVANIFRMINISNENELLKSAFKILRIVIDELYKMENYELVHRINNVKEIHFTKNILLKVNRFDLDVLLFQRIVALTMLKNGDHVQAEALFHSIFDKLMHVESSNTTDEHSRENTESVKFYLLLLTSSDIAYTKHLMCKCKESYKLYKDVLDKIMNLLGIDGDVKELSCAMYKIIRKSEKYRNIVAFNNKSLNILHIREAIANELVCLGDKFSKTVSERRLRNREEVFNKAVKSYQDAIKIHEDNVGIKRIYSELHYDVSKNVHVIASSYNRLGDLRFRYLKSIKEKLTNESLIEMLNFYYKALEMYSVIATCQELRNRLSINTKFLTEVTLNLNNMGMCHKEFGISIFGSDAKEALRNFENALYIFERHYKFLVKKFGENHKNSTNKSVEIAFMAYRVKNLKLRCNLRK